jgi:hypothetical protein
LRELGLDKPQSYEPSHPRHSNDEEDDEGDFGDPADLAIAEHPGRNGDHRKPVVDFTSVTFDELDALCDHFGAALIWASENRPGLLQMGARWLVIFNLMRPHSIGGMNMRIPKALEFRLRAVLVGRDPLDTGDFFRRPLRWVRDCTSLAQLGQRGWSLIYAMRQSSVGSITNEQIGAFHNKTRQAANKLIQDFRDTFSGMKNLAMRGEETRKRCKKAQMAE